MEEYDVMDHKEHVLKKPSTYIGSIELGTFEDTWICEDNKFVKKDIKITPGFYNIFNEILTNASDQCLRTRDFLKKNKTVNITKTIKVELHDDGKISVFNDGDGITVEKFKDTGKYIPEIVFGVLLSSSNYDDKKERTWGGMNGYGGKTCMRKGTILPLFAGKFSKIENISIGTELIGDDGTPRKVIGITTGNDKLFEVSQKTGDPYVVNENHILCLRLADHKVIFWNNTNYCWNMIWLNKKENKIQSRQISGGKSNIICPECKINLSGNLPRHYRRLHKNVELPKIPRKSPVITAPDTLEVKEALLEMKEFSKTIPDDNTLDISVKEYLKLNKTMHLRLTGYIAKCVQWKHQDVEIDPYVLGLWLGDGSKRGKQFSINFTDDPEILEYLVNWGKDNDVKFTLIKNKLIKPVDFSLSSLSKCGISPLKKLLTKYNLINNKRIPLEYIVNSREIRLKVLAGLIDSDGYTTRNGTRITITQGMNHKKLTDDIIYLVKSLGFMCCSRKIKTTWAYKGEHKKGHAIRINISGIGADDIPTLVPRKKCSSPVKRNTISTGNLTIKEVKSDDFIGLAVDGNKRFALEDFTVTHNCNLFSSYFELETVDHRNKKKLNQVWLNNMSEPEKKAKVTSCKTKPYTKITFLPDYKRFGMKNGLGDDVKNLIKKRCYDIAGITPKDVTVHFNDEKLSVKNFEQYAKMYSEDKCIYEKINDRWEIAACASPDGTFQHVALVNGIFNMNGGKHVDFISSKIARGLVKNINGNKKTGVTSTHVKNNLWVFVNSFIVNPAFSSQTKEMLTTPSTKFGKFEISDNFIKKLEKTDIVKRAKLMKSFHDKSGLSKTDGKKTRTIRGIPKLDDANWAGTTRSDQCTLILTEGDSAKTMVISGLSVVGRDKYGVFPLKGKLLNTRDASDKVLSGNVEIQNIKKILGLQQSTKSVKELRYGKVMLLTDQDLDGYHIKGLLMNFIECQWPDLIKENFIITMYTPIVKVKKGKKVIKSFYNTQDYEIWKNNQSSLNGFTIKYYKGLGTSNSQEAKEYFKELNLIQYKWCDNSKNSLDLAFNKKRADNRKTWLSSYNPDNVIDNTQKNVIVDDFINKELIHFSTYDNYRSIPSMCDGFKPSQRKATYTCLTTNQTKEIKVAQLVGIATSKTLSHHGESSMEGTIVGLAQNYVGSNNINLLKPAGQFGTRLAGGNDAAQSRYIFTHLENITKMVFRKEDEALLNNLIEETQVIEPYWYMPILPVILINGARGIGTGFSTHIPCYNPLDIISNIKRLLDNKEIKSLKPWYNKFKGSIIEKDEKYFTQGKYSFKSPTQLEITELPIGVWTNDYHEYLEKLTYDNSEKDKKLQCITDYKKCNDHDDVNVHLILSFKKTDLDKFKSDDDKLKKMFKLEESKSCSTTNLHLFDPIGNIVKFKSVDGILCSFYTIRLAFYGKRKEYQTKFLKREIRFLKERIRFVKGIIDETIHISKKPNNEILEEIQEKHKFLSDPSKDEIFIEKISDSVYENALKDFVHRYADSKQQVFSDSDSDSDSSSSSDSEVKDEVKDTRDIKKILSEDYGYLLMMHIWSLTKEKLDELKKTLSQKEKDLDYIVNISPKDLWRNDLNEFEKEYKKM